MRRRSSAKMRVNSQLAREWEIDEVERINHQQLMEVETDEARDLRLQVDRINHQQVREVETDEARDLRLQVDRFNH